MKQFSKRQVLDFMLLIACLVTLQPLLAQTIEVPIDVQFDFLLKAVSFDTALKPRQGNHLKITVLYQSGVMSSVQALNETQNYVRANPSKIVHGFSVNFQYFDLTEPMAVDSMIRSDSIDMIYVLPLRAISIATIAKIAREHQVHTLSALPEYVYQGLAMGMRKKGDKSEVLFNLQALTDEGAEFPLRVLKLGTLIDD